MTKKTPQFPELPQEAEASLQAGRINREQAETIARVTRESGPVSGLRSLQYLEKLNSIREYFTAALFGFNLRELRYSAEHTSREAKQKIIVALQEALNIVEFDLKWEERQAAVASKEEPPCE